MDDWEDEPEPPVEKPRDQEIDRATESVLKLIEARPQRVFYSTEIETHLEREHFHWIAAKALLETGRAGKIQTVQLRLQEKPVNFYAHRSNRYFKRDLKDKVRLLERIYHPDFTHAVGTTAELMFDSAFARREFLIKAKNAQAWKDQVWTRTNHNLDRIVTRDGIDYGVEIKNTQNYINRNELDIKLQMCQHLHLKPLFILRFAPKPYMNSIIQQGGFGLLFEEQIYPMGFTELMTEVKSKLGLKVHSPRDIKDGDMQRLMNWHLKKAKLT